MHGDDDGRNVAAAIIRSRDADTGVRLDAVQELAEWVGKKEVRDRLSEMLRDQNVTVMVDAAELLARWGGESGIRTILEELGRNADDAETDYIMYKLEELQALGEVSVLRTARLMDNSRESPEFRSGLDDIEDYMGHHDPK